MGDKSPKSKEKGQKQKAAASQQGAASAKSKQDSFSKTAQNTAKIAPKGKR